MKNVLFFSPIGRGVGWVETSIGKFQFQFEAFPKPSNSSFDTPPSPGGNNYSSCKLRIALPLFARMSTLLLAFYNLTFSRHKREQNLSDNFTDMETPAALNSLQWESLSQISGISGQTNKSE